MTELLREMEPILGDLLRSGLDTGGPASAEKLRALAGRCEAAGLHTGAALLTELADGLTARPHALQKNDLPLVDTLCRLARYEALCRQKLQEEAIVARWQYLAEEQQPDT